MKQYLDALQTIKDNGTLKQGARAGMPSTLSLFGHQFRHNLSDGFPMLTTKKLSWKNIVVELLWFMRGDTNIKYLVDNGCNIWNEDAYNFYLKQIVPGDNDTVPMPFDEFVLRVKNGILPASRLESDRYKLGDCGKQYGWLWRNWNKWDFEKGKVIELPNGDKIKTEALVNRPVDQLKELIQGLKSNPMSRRHIITAWNPATLDDMALNACHAMVQFNCRALSKVGRMTALLKKGTFISYFVEPSHEELDRDGAPRYILDCQLYQRSADVFLGVPYNIASYGLLTSILAEILNMVPGDFIHTFGDVHIYDNHIDQVDEQLTREPKSLPKLKFSDWFKNSVKEKHWENDFDEWISSLKPTDFELVGYESHPAIKGKLSTGLQ